MALVPPLGEPLVLPMAGAVEVLPDPVGRLAGEVEVLGTWARKEFAGRRSGATGNVRLLTNLLTKN